MAAVAKALYKLMNNRPSPSANARTIPIWVSRLVAATTERGYRKASNNRAEKETGDRHDPKEYRRRRSSEADLGEGVGHERGTTEDDKVPRDPGYDRDYCPGHERIPHEFVARDILQVCEDVRAEGNRTEAQTRSPWCSSTPIIATLPCGSRRTSTWTP